MPAAICWNEWALCCQSRKLGYETHTREKRGLFSHTITRRSGWKYCSGANRTPSTTLNIAVLAPIPRARVSTATAANPGDLASIRIPYFRSCQSVSMVHLSRRKIKHALLQGLYASRTLTNWENVVRVTPMAAEW